jgi:D-amino-acid oxidase
MASYHILSQLSANDAFDHGIRMRIANFFFTTPVHELPQQLNKMHEIAGSGVHGFRRDPKIISEQGISPAAGLVDAYQHVAPVIDTDAYMVWLRSLVLQKGAKLQTAHISGDLLDYERRLLSTYGACAIVNATGLESKELAGDPTVFPLRGGLIRVVNDGAKFPRITQALCVSHDDSNPNDDGFVFILPRNDNVLLLGGIAQENKWELDLTLDSPEMKRIRARCNAFIPGLANAQLDPEAPIVQGLRPLTTTNVKVMRESRGKRKSKIVHNYGHGGSGFSFSFGCAAQVLGIVQGILREEQPAETEMLMAKL